MGSGSPDYKMLVESTVSGHFSNAAFSVSLVVEAQEAKKPNVKHYQLFSGVFLLIASGET